MQQLQNSQVPYELRKTIRFVLKSKEIKRQYDPVKNTKDDLGDKIKDFIDKYNYVIENFNKLIFFVSEKDREKGLKKKIYIKHSWLRNYIKTEFYNVKENIITYDDKRRKRSNQVSISNSNLGFLKDYFENWIIENKDCVKNLQSFLNQPEENQKRISEFAYWIQKISKRSNLEAIFELFNGNIQHKDNDKEIFDIKKILDECKPLLKNLEKELLPSQSLGVEIERASLNYYTVNKTPKNYDQEMKDKENSLSQKYIFQQNDITLFNSVGFDKKDLPIGELKQAMKAFKAEQKSKFYEFVSSDKGYINLKTDPELKLLNDISEDNFNKFKAETDKQKKGKHFQFSFTNYKNFCNTYKNVAVDFGKIKAEIKTLEKEKIDAERLQSWAVILEKDNQRYILTIPRDANNNLSDAKKHIDGLQNDKNGIWKLYFFESLTLQALDKLCFGFDKNTFYPAIKDELKQKESSFFDGYNLKRKDQFSDDGKELIKFYQIVLGLESTKKMLAIDNFNGLNGITQKNYENKEDFEKDLKQACYYKRVITISEYTKNKLIADFQGNFYKITSYDLEKNDVEVLEKLENKKQLDRNNPEIHTKIWLDFWTDENTQNRHDIRLNPEFKVNFVEKNLNELKNKKLGGLKKNRKQDDQFLLSTTVTLQAHDKNADLAFKKTDEIVGFINEYNQEFNSKIKPFDIYYYGLDRGQKELLTLGLFKFSEMKKVNFTGQDGTAGEYNKPEFIDIEAYQIKLDQFLETNEKGRVAYKSISEFIDDSNVVEKIIINSCFDMSAAKLVKDKIVINGDIATYLELKRVSTLRKIYEGATRDKFRSNQICFDANKGALFLNIENRGKLENENLYFYDDQFESILSLDKIRKELQDYYNTLKQQGSIEIITIDKINNLRDALCANAVGILNHLQKQYFGMMFLENLDINNKTKRTSEFSGNLASRIEWKLLQKFQTLSLVPPNYKQAMTLQSKKEIDQFGIVAYVRTEGTSNECPHCGTKNTDKSEKWERHTYECVNTKCGFDSSDENKRNGFVGLDDSDKVASYNIAKRGLELLQSKKQKLNIK